jgi:hypothetical protein
MNSTNTHRKTEAWRPARRTPRTDRPFEPADDAPRSESPVQGVMPNLVESDEYEWTTSACLPGLIVSPVQMPPETPAAAPMARRTVSEIIESEDGDVVSACQLPGGLTTDEVGDFAPFSLGRPRGLPGTSRGEVPGELDEADEYANAAAMQLPGSIVAAQCIGASAGDGEAATCPAVHGLCASCVHNATCDFPRPPGGVWSCEEYA